jgi:hypothetical protein
LWYLKSGALLVLQDLVSDSDDGDEFEWDNDGDGEAESSDGDEFEWDSEGDGEAGSLSTAGSSVQTSRNLHAPGPSTLARLVSEKKMIDITDYLLVHYIFVPVIWSYGYDLSCGVFLCNCEKDSNGERDNGVASSVYTIDYFVGMGFSREIVLKAMTENGTTILITDF